MQFPRILAVALGAVAPGAPAIAGAGDAVAVPATEVASPIGRILAAADGMTLYVFAQDPPGRATCIDACAAEWPPLLADEVERTGGRFSVIERPDDTYQWAADGHPLYLYREDKAPGDIRGAGEDAAWSVARP